MPRDRLKAKTQRKGPRTRALARHKPYPMTDVDPAGLEQFIATGRTGRRNAVPDIMDPVTKETSTAPLPYQMEKLHCSEDSEASKSDTASAPAPQNDDSSTENKDGAKKS